MQQYYITFGQDHCHRINEKTFDCNSVGVITANDYGQARDIAFELTGGKFSFMYNSQEEVGMEYYPRGLLFMN